MEETNVKNKRPPKLLLLSPPSISKEKHLRLNLNKKNNSTSLFPSLNSNPTPKLKHSPMNSTFNIPSSQKSQRITHRKQPRTIFTRATSKEKPLKTISDQLHADIMKISDHTSQIIKEIKSSKQDHLNYSSSQTHSKTLSKIRTNFTFYKTKTKVNLRKALFPTAIQNKIKPSIFHSKQKRKKKEDTLLTDTYNKDLNAITINNSHNLDKTNINDSKNNTYNSNRTITNGIMKKRIPNQNTSDFTLNNIINSHHRNMSSSASSSFLQKSESNDNITPPQNKNRFTYSIEEIIQKHKFTNSIPIHFASTLSSKQLSTEYKYKYIIDRLTIILDNLSFFRDKFARHPLLKESFFNLNKSFQIKFNKDFELLISLCLEIPKLILGDFYVSLDQLLLCKIPNINEYIDKLYSTEYEIFQSNIQLIIEIFTYLSACKEVFELLIQKVERMKISAKQFKIIEQYIHFSRYYSSRIVNLCQTYIDKTIQDKSFLNKLEEEVQLKPKTKKKPVDILTRIQNKGLKLNAETRKINRVENALKENKNDTQENVKKHLCLTASRPQSVRSMLHSNILSKLLKYVHKPTREKIIAQRIIDRYNERKDKKMLSSL